MRDTIIGAAIILAVSALPNCAEASESHRVDHKHGVSVETVCRIQNVIRFRESAWTTEACDGVAAAVNATRDPVLTLAIAINESDLRPNAMAVTGESVVDVGLMGIRCRLVRGRCANGEVKGLTLANLRDPATNIRVGAAILEAKRASHGKRFLGGYNGETTPGGYAERIRAIAEAIKGRLVAVESRRVRKLCAQIVGAIRGNGKS